MATGWDETSKPTESSIIARGLWIVEKVFCQHIPIAPNIPKIDEAAAGNKGKTPRELLKIHREKPSCASFHNIMDPAGYALENFGPLGQYREKYADGLPEDSCFFRFFRASRALIQPLRRPKTEPGCTSTSPWAALTRTGHLQPES